jgi:saccharopine dehydrogenase (NAD+, L-lysine-forming)
LERILKGTDILITGGYGTVGRRVAADLAPDYPGRVVVAGRSAEKAAQLAAELGHGVRGRRVDVGEPLSVEAALEGVGVVLSCIDQPEPHLLRAAIRRGLAYTDIAPHLITRRPTEVMKAEAAQTGARIVLGAGLAPGISSMLARLGADRLGAVDSVEVGVLLSVGDAYGPASRAYIMEEIALAYKTRIEGREVPVRPFAASARVTFPHLWESTRRTYSRSPTRSSSPRHSVPGRRSLAWRSTHRGSGRCSRRSYGYG